MRWPATSAAAAPIRVSALQSNGRPASRRPACLMLSTLRRFEMKTASIETHGIVSSSRRNFLKLTATAAIGGGLTLGFGLPTRGEVRDSLTTDAPFAPNAFLRIDRAGKVTFVMPLIEMGQGTYTSLPMLIAEELEVDVDKVAIEHSPPDDKVYANPLIGVQLTGGSTAIRGLYVPLRNAGATARVMLVTAAAQRWNVDPSACRAENGVVVHAPSGRKLGYGALVDAAAKLPVPEKVALKEPADFKLIGTPHRRLDTTGKVNGSAKFGIDTRLPGMKFAVVAASPTFGGKLVSVDEAKAKAVHGVSQVVRLDDAVAVVAIHTWAAKQGLAAAAPQWDAGPNAKLSTADIVAQLAAASEKPGAVARHDGDAAAAIARAAQKIDAVYEQPFLAHAAMEPMNCTVHLTKEGCDIWVGTQIPGMTQAAVMKLTGLTREQVRIHNHLLGGGFGRRLEYDGTVRAVQIAQQVQGPVQVIWTREEDIQHDMYRPYYYDRLSAGLDAQGRPTGWLHRIAGSSILARYFPAFIKDRIDSDAVESSANLPYGFSAIHVEWVAQEPPGIPTAFWRGVGVTRGTFAVESFIDELAASAKQDPLAYRVALLEKSPRAKTVLGIAAERSGWGKPLPAGQGRGIALCIGFGSFIAQVVQVSVDKDGTVNPTHVSCVVPALTNAIFAATGKRIRKLPVGDQARTEA